jgi:hypothetical protein
VVVGGVDVAEEEEVEAVLIVLADFDARIGGIPCGGQAPRHQVAWFI